MINNEIGTILKQKIDIESTTSNNSSPDLSNRRNKKPARRSKMQPSVELSGSESSLDMSPIQCNCSEHTGKEMLNINYNLNVNNLFEALFGHTEFCVKFWESRKFFDMKIGEWETVDEIRTRRLEYNVQLNSPVPNIKQCKNTEDQVC